jgi:hypothetical protein
MRKGLFADTQVQVVGTQNLIPIRLDLVVECAEHLGNGPLLGEGRQGDFETGQIWPSNRCH